MALLEDFQDRFGGGRATMFPSIPGPDYLTRDVDGSGFAIRNAKILDAGGAEYNVKAFGAVGDGVTNDFAAVAAAHTAAVNAGAGTVVFPPGRYYLPGAFYFQNPYVTWRGATRGPFFLTGNPALNTQAAILLITAASAEFLFVAEWGITFEDLVFAYPNQIRGNAAAPITPVVYPYTLRIETGNCTVRRCTFYNSYDAIRIRNGLYRIEDCIVFGLHNDIYLDRAVDIGWISKINGGTGYFAAGSAMETWLYANKTSWDIRRADGIRINTIQLGGCNIAMKFSANTADVDYTGGAYGTIQGLDIDGCNHGIWASSTRGGGGGVTVTNFNIAQNAGGAGSAVTVVAPPVGADPVRLRMIGGCIRGTWALGPVTSPQTTAAGLVQIEKCLGLDLPAGYLATQPAVPSSTTAFLSPFAHPVQVEVIGGTVSSIARSGQTTGRTSGMFVLGAGETITLVYTVAPTWKWFSG